VPALGDGHRWVLVNISAAVAQQIADDTLPASAAGLAAAAVRAVVLTDAQLEHVGGLLALRGGAPIDLYATPAVFEELSCNLPVLPALQHYCGVHWRVIPVAGDRLSAGFRVEGLPSLEFTAVATQAPPLPHAQPQRAVVGDHIALVVRDLASGCQVFCAPGLVDPGPQELEWMRASDCVLLGDTPLEAGRGVAALEWMAQLPARLKVMLAGADLPQRQLLARRGIAVASDGMEIDL
jgi:pyrroloquinoline quinone biosynthesis protein B